MFPMSVRELVFWGWINVYLWTPLGYFFAILQLFSQSLSTVLWCGVLLLNVTFSFLSTRWIWWRGFVLLGLVCFTRLIQSLITVCSVSFHLLLPEFDIPKLWPQLIHWSLKYQGVEHPNLLGLSCWLRFDCGMTFHTLCLTLECWIHSRVQSTISCFPELCFLQFYMAQVLVGCKSNL